MSDMEFTSTAHYKALGERKLVGSRCKSCGKLFFPARPMCPECHGKNMEATELSGKGKLTAYSVIYIATTAMIQAGFDRKNPYCAAVVQLNEGPSICAQVIGADVAHPETIKIGSPVIATFLDRGEGETKKTFLGFQI
ncbi:MAG: Zn-ribbon domain-containing OB-fold protein [Chloroflexi bacterium]|nr:Zn-ribbon domain-containing OB-fold protein [Chloroflexota bacterium]